MTHERKLGEVFTDEECGELLVVKTLDCAHCALQPWTERCGVTYFGPCTEEERTDRVNVAFINKGAYLRFKLTGEWDGESGSP